MKYKYYFYKIPLLFFVFFLLSVVSFAQAIIKGKVTDAQTGEPLTGATAHLAGSINLNTAIKLDGSYMFKNVPVGSYKLTIRFIGYKTSKEYTVAAETGRQTVLNIALVDNLTDLTEVTIKEHSSKETDHSARGLEKNADMVLNVLSANTIQLLPDVTVGNALQRVSGVTIQRTSTGEGRYAIIRGMEQRYNSTLVNGIKIPSPDDQFRFIPMDIFPSEMLERLEVIKALTPNMEGDAIGGTMNLIMKTAPDRFTISANVSGGFSTIFSKSRPFTGFSANGLNRLAPSELHNNDYAATYADFNNSAITSNKMQNSPLSSTMGLTIGDRFLNHKLGVIVSASYQNIYRGSNSFELTPNASPDGTSAGNNSPQFSDSYSRQYSTQTQRLGIHNRIDYIFNSKNKISLYNLYLRTNEYISRLSADTLGLGLNSTSQNKQVTISDRSTYTQQNVYNGTLQGEHTLADKLKFNWSAVYSIAKRNQPDRTDFSFDKNPTLNSAGVITKIDSNNIALSHHWERNSDKDIDGYGTFIYTPKIANTDVEFQVGGLYRHKNRNAYYNQYDFIARTSNYHGDIGAVPFDFKIPSNALGSYNTALTNDYTVTEDINAEFLQFKFRVFDRLQVLGGARVENTLQKYDTQAALTSPQRSGTKAYTDVLPSLHLKYDLTDAQALRLSYFASISRPGFGEIIPSRTDGEYYSTAGNAGLKHVTADNYDFRYELFPGGADQILLGAFYKQIYNPIEYHITTPDGPSKLVLQPVNSANSAKNLGFEAQITKYFGVIGFSVNYTYTHSRVQDTTLVNYIGASGIQNKYITQSRPLQGQADQVGNASVLFKSAKLGLDMQLAFVYTGERLAVIGNYQSLYYYYKPFNQLDFSFEKKIAKRISVFGKVNNLTNTANRIFLKAPYSSVSAKQQEFLGTQTNAAETLVQSDYYKLSFLGGLRYKF